MAEKHLKNTKKIKEKHIEEEGEIRKGERRRAPSLSLGAMDYYYYYCSTYEEAIVLSK